MVAFDQWCCDTAGEIFEYRLPKNGNSDHLREIKRKEYCIVHTRYLLFRKGVFMSLCMMGDKPGQSSAALITNIMKEDPIGVMRVMGPMSAWFYSMNQDSGMKILGGSCLCGPL